MTVESFSTKALSQIEGRYARNARPARARVVAGLQNNYAVSACSSKQLLEISLYLAFYFSSSSLTYRTLLSIT